MGDLCARLCSQGAAVGALALALGSVLALPACTPPAPREGSACVFNVDCKAPLVCAGGRCRVVCRTDLDCPVERVCRSGAEPGTFRCVPPGDPPLCIDTSQCAEHQFCAVDGYCRPECVTNYDCRLVAPGSVCGPDGACARVDGGASDAADVIALPDARGDAAAMDAAMDAAVDVPGAMDVAATLSDRAFLADAPHLDVPADAFPTPQIVSVYDSNGHGCAVLNAGAVYCWGSNTYGQLGTGATGARTDAPVRATVFDRPVAQVVAGGDLTCVREVAGAVRCVGSSGTGLGDGVTTSSVRPIAPMGITDAIDLVHDGSRGCVVLRDRTVRCWGDNSGGALGNTSAGFQSAVPVVVTDVSNAARVYTAYNFGLALLTDGTLMCWGTNAGGASCGRPNDGVSTAVAVPGVGTVTAVAANAGMRTACALSTDGLVRCWGDTAFGLTGQPAGAPLLVPTVVPGITGATDVGMAVEAACAVVSGGASVVCWGRENTGVLGLGLVDAGGGHTMTPVTVVGVRGVAQLAMGAGFGAIALLRSGGATCWGAGSSNLCGHTYGELTPWPLRVP